MYNLKNDSKEKKKSKLHHTKVSTNQKVQGKNGTRKCPRDAFLCFDDREAVKGQAKRRECGSPSKRESTAEEGNNWWPGRPRFRGGAAGARLDAAASFPFNRFLFPRSMISWSRAWSMKGF